LAIDRVPVRSAFHATPRLLTPTIRFSGCTSPTLEQQLTGHLWVATPRSTRREPPRDLNHMHTSQVEQRVDTRCSKPRPGTAQHNVGSTDIAASDTTRATHPPRTPKGPVIRRQGRTRSDRDRLLTIDKPRPRGRDALSIIQQPDTRIMDDEPRLGNCELSCYYCTSVGVDGVQFIEQCAGFPCGAQPSH